MSLTYSFEALSFSSPDEHAGPLTRKAPSRPQLEIDQLPSIIINAPEDINNNNPTLHIIPASSRSPSLSHSVKSQRSDSFSVTFWRPGAGGSARQLLTRSRSTSSVRNGSSYDLPRDLEPINAYPSPQPQAEGHLSPHSHTHSAPPSPSPYTASPQSEDAFQRYKHATDPTLQRDTIASETVLQASAKRRKKAATYECNQCGQLNNHTDAHTGVRRHRCDYCHERFRTRSVLKRHQKSAKCPASRLVPKQKEFEQARNEAIQ